jgi:uncharacterized protein (DUF2249 family)
MNAASTTTIDLRQIDAFERHVLVFEHLARLAAGGELQLFGDDDPFAWQDQIERQWPGRFACSPLDGGGASWRLAVRRTAPVPVAAAASCCSGGACCG